MRIAHFIVGRCNPDSANGVDKTVYYLSKAQAKFGHIVAVFSLTDKAPKDIPVVLVKIYSPIRFPFRLPKSLLLDLYEWQPNLVHLHSVYTPPNVALASWLHKQGIPYVVTPHGGLSPYVLRRRWHLKAPYRLLFELPTLNRALFVHAVADVENIKNYGVRVPIVTAPNGMDLTMIPTNLNKELLAHHFPQVHGKRVFLFLGRLDPLHKGLDLLIEGFSLAQIEDASLVLVGPDWQGSRRALETLSHELGIASQVIFTGPVYGKEKFDFLASADVFVHTSRWEAGVPFSVLEATAVAKPCLTTVAADPSAMLFRYQAGIIVSSEGRDIAKGLKQLAIMSTTDLQVIGERAREMVKTEFSWRKTALILTEAYTTYKPRSDSAKLK